MPSQTLADLERTERYLRDRLHTQQGLMQIAKSANAYGRAAERANAYYIALYYVRRAIKEHSKCQ